MADYFICPHCEAEVPAGASACPECGSDDQTGWSANADSYGVLPADDEDVETHRPVSSRPWTRYVLAVLVILVLLAYPMLRLRWGVYLIPVALLAVGIVFYLFRVLPRGGRGGERALYRELLQRARGDEDLAERLIEYERQRNPGAGRRKLLQDAIDRWEVDHR